MTAVGLLSPFVNKKAILRHLGVFVKDKIRETKVFWL
jgi:hypothetical protein